MSLAFASKTTSALDIDGTASGQRGAKPNSARVMLQPWLSSGIVSEVFERSRDVRLFDGTPIARQSFDIVTERPIVGWADGSTNWVPSVKASPATNNGTIVSQKPTEIPVERKAPRPVPKYIRLQEWEGVVERTHGQEISVLVGDVDDASQDLTDLAILHIQDLSESDRIKAVPGAVFRWVIGYEIQGQQRRRFSQVIFRDLPGWSKRRIDTARSEARRIAASLPELE